MKKFYFALLAVAACLASCSGNKGVQLLPEENFATEVDGKPVGLYTLTNGDLTMQVTNFGARVVTLWTPDRKGRMADVVLGYDNIDKYLNNTGERFLGACVGPYANRIAGGEIEIDGKKYELPKNNNGQTLHGGLKGLDMVVWDVIAADSTSVFLRYVHPDGQDGYPGNIVIAMKYELTADNEFVVTYRAATDAPTYVNLSHHPFFNLKGEGNGTILDNVMTINASRTTPVDEYLIPVGGYADVTGTPFDFREPHTIGERINEENAQLANGGGYDHNWVLDRKTVSGIESAATVYEPSTGRFLEVLTDQPGLQFYSGNFFDGKSTGKYGRPLRYRESLALETQKFPDSPHHPEFPSTRVDPGEMYTQVCIYRFSVK
ncbi:MAG: aldose epimerase family protein [Candidatus Cryptobacteroides sp.]